MKRTQGYPLLAPAGTWLCGGRLRCTGSQARRHAGCAAPGRLQTCLPCCPAPRLQWALELQGRMDELFWDAQHGGYFNNAGDDPSIKMRLKVGAPLPGGIAGPEGIEKAGGTFGTHLPLVPGVIPCWHSPPASSVTCSCSPKHTGAVPTGPMSLQEDYDGAEPAASSIAAANLWYVAGLSGTEVRCSLGLASSCFLGHLQLASVSFALAAFGRACRSTGMPVGAGQPVGACGCPHLPRLF